MPMKLKTLYLIFLQLSAEIYHHL